MKLFVLFLCFESYSPFGVHSSILCFFRNDQAATKKKNNVEKQTGTKILVRNIPFQATEKELLQLFK